MKISCPLNPAPVPRRAAARCLLGGFLALLALALPALPVRAQGLAAKYFRGAQGQGGPIQGLLTQAPDGNFYGLTQYSGDDQTGAVIRLTPEGVATTVYTFSALDPSGHNAEGAVPSSQGSLILGRDGNLYGATTQGGANGVGTVFRFTTAGVVTAVGSFLPPYGAGPLVQDRAGNTFVLYQGGAILKVTPAGLVTVFHQFSPLDASNHNVEGAGPKLGFAIDGQDNLYGFTYYGGAYGNGTFYQVSPGGAAVALYNYDFSVPSSQPHPPDNRPGSIVAIPGGTVYGVDSGGGGVSGGPGVGTYHGGFVFKANGGQPAAIYTFSDGIFQDDGSFRNTDGVDPNGVTLGPDGNLYGVTASGGANGTGTVFRLTPGGAFTLLYTFPPGTGGYAPPILSTDGDLFGNSGGSLGAFYRLGATLLPVFNAPSLTLTATQGVPLSFQLVAANDPTSFSASGLPAGLTLDPTTGLITGATTAPLGVYPVALTANNPDGSSTATLTITVQAPAPDAPVVNVPGTPLSASVGEPFSYQLDATNKPTSYQITGLPAGVTYDPKTGIIRGLFANAGKILLQIQATNASGTGSASLEIDVAPAGALPTVTVAGDSPDANAATGQAGAFVLTLSAPAATDLKVAYTLKGSAANGTDYQMLKGTVKIKAGKTGKNLTVVPLGQPTGGSKKVVKLTLAPGAGYTVGTPGPVKVKIAEGN